MSDIVEFPKTRVVEIDVPDAVRLDATVSRCLAACEKMDEVMKLMIGVIAHMDRRIKALEHAERNRSRIARPVIMNG